MSSLSVRCIRRFPISIHLPRKFQPVQTAKRNYSSLPGSFFARHHQRYVGPLVGLGGFVLAYGLYAQKRKTVEAATSTTSSKYEFGKVPLRPDLPTFDLRQVAEHNSLEKGVWVTYGGGVYNVTDFVSVHPGGMEKIKLAYGGPLEPFWSLYAVHKSEEVLKILEAMRVGNLNPSEAAKLAEDFEKDPYSKDPPRHPALMPCSIKPFNAESPPEELTDDFLTPNELFFVRNHLPVPVVDVEKYALEVGGIGLPNRRFTLDELKRKYKPVTVTATIQCAGNRRNEMNPVKPVKGLAWGFTAISNASWTGVRLSDVLADVGLNSDRARRNEGMWNHVHFEGLDADPTGQRYGASVPVDKAVDARGDVILAYEMNGQPLSPDHGYPLRAIVPGIVGARNVKWLSKIYVSDEESESHWQQNDYKSFSPSTDWDTVDFKSAPAIQEAPVQSAICVPLNEQELPKGAQEIEVKGYAWSGGGRGIVRVDVSADSGKTWTTANLKQATQPLDRMWAWSLWSCKLPIRSDNITKDGKVRLMCKATDLSYNVQPDDVSGIWNLRGVLNNAWHKVTVHMEQ